MLLAAATTVVPVQVGLTAAQPSIWFQRCDAAVRKTAQRTAFHPCGAQCWWAHRIQGLHR